MSRKPSVAMRAVTAPLRSMMALVASVVPWMKRVISPGATPMSSSNSSVPAITACSGAWGVVSTLRVQRCAPASTTMSVKVPPMSTARRLGGAGLVTGKPYQTGRKGRGVRPISIAPSASARERRRRSPPSIPRHRDGVVQPQAAAVGIDRLSRDVGGVVAGEEGGDRCHLRGLAESADGGAGEDPARGRLVLEDGGARHIGQDGAGADGDGADAMGSQRHGHDFGQLVDAALGGRVGDLVGDRE